jgi:colanic acid biosynthesis glycosyl transferase WcaI
VKIQYVSQYFPPEVCAPAARVSELSDHWTAEGHQVTVLTGFPNHPTGVLAPGFRGKFWRLVSRERRGTARVVRTWLVPLPNRKAWERVVNYASFCLSACATGTFLRRPEVVIATSPQLLVGLSGWWLSLVKRVPFVLEVRDLWPESLVAVGMGGQDSLTVRVLRVISRFLYRRCDHIVVVTPAFKTELVERWSVSPEKISVVENGVETDLFSPEGGDGERDFAPELQNRFVVSYIGTQGVAHGLETVFRAAEMLSERLPDVLFLFVGEGADKERLMVRAREVGLTNVCFLPQQPRARIPALVRRSDVCLVLLRKAEVFKTVIPTKMLEFMACGRPVILAVDGQARQIVEEAGAGLCIEPEDSQALAEAVTKLYLDAPLRGKLGANGRRYIVEKLSRKSTAGKYIEVLKGLLLRKGKRRAALSHASESPYAGDGPV